MKHLLAHKYELSQMCHRWPSEDFTKPGVERAWPSICWNPSGLASLVQQFGKLSDYQIGQLVLLVQYYQLWLTEGSLGFGAEVCTGDWTWDLCMEKMLSEWQPFCKSTSDTTVPDGFSSEYKFDSAWFWNKAWSSVFRTLRTIISKATLSLSLQ